MITRMFCVQFVSGVLLFSVFRDCRADDNELRLIRHLLANYDASARPAANASHAMQVIFGMSLHLIIDVDERGQILTTNCWLTQQWNDTHLTWNASDYGGITVVRIPYQRVWRPDIILYNNADAQYGSSIINTNVIVSDGGQVVWLSHGIFRSSCDINVEFFPFDIQSCKMKWASWTYDGYQIDLVKQTEVGDLTNYQTNGEFDLVGMEAVYHEEYYSCCPEPYPDITYIIKMRRRPLFYVFNLILPCILINGIALLVFYVPAESGEKVTLGISSLLSMTVFLMTIRESLPPTEKTPLISLYYGVSICLVSFASGLSVVTLNLHHRGLRGTDVPYVVRKVVLGGLARLVFLSFDAPKMRRNAESSRPTCTCSEGAKRRAKTSAAKSGAASSWRHASATSAGPNGLSTISTSGVRLDAESVEKFTRRSPDPLDFLGLGPPSPRCYTRRPPAGRPASVEIGVGGGGTVGSSAVGAGPSTGSAASCSLESYEQRLSLMLTRVTAAIERNEARLEDQDRREAIQLEWKQVALVCDRTLLIVFFVVTTVATCLILMSSPYGP